MMYLDELKNVLERATQGDWEWLPQGDNYNREPTCDENLTMGALYAGENLIAWFGDCESYYPTEGDPPSDADAAAIVALHNAAPALIAELEALRAENGRLREALESAALGLDQGADRSASPNDMATWADDARQTLNQTGE